MELNRQNLGDCRKDCLKSGIVDPVRNQLHQAARSLKAVRSLTCQSGAAAPDNVIQCLKQINTSLDSLCQNLKELDCLHCQERGDTAGLNGQSEACKGRDVETGQAFWQEPDRDNPKPVPFNCGINDSAPTLHSILAGLNSPADFEYSPSTGREDISLSNEDLLGLEMLKLVSAGTRDFAWNSVHAESGMRAIEHHSLPIVSDPCRQELTRSQVCSPALSAEFAKHPDPPPVRCAPTGKGVAESIYESAFSGDCSLFTVEAVANPVDNSGSPTLQFSNPDSGSYPDSQTDRETGNSGNGKTDFVRSNIKTCNREKLEALRQRLQKIFARQSRSK